MPLHPTEKESIKAVISKTIIHASCPWEASIRSLGPQNKGLVWWLPHDTGVLPVPGLTLATSLLLLASPARLDYDAANIPKQY